MTNEADMLFEKYNAQLSAMIEALRVELTAFAWKIAAKVVAEQLPRRVMVGTLSWNGKKTKLAIPAPNKTKVSYTPKHHDPVKRVIKGSGEISLKKADKYTDLLVGKKNGLWSRRGSTKVMYTCEGWQSVPQGVNPVVYLMKNQKTGKTINVKFDSIVHDWTFTDAVPDEMLRQAA